MSNKNIIIIIDINVWIDERNNEIAFNYTECHSFDGQI